MMQTDVKGATCAANGSTTAYNGRTRLKGLWYSATGAGTIAVKDNATTLFTLTIGGAESNYVLLPGEGVLVQTSLVITNSAAVAGVAFYG
ncbi:hypothetical protein EBT31_19080 [bacterium]|jgi:hypothetical protein|nr:hypothetical protein [bacterium]